MSEERQGESVKDASPTSDTANLEAFVEPPQESVEEVVEAERREAELDDSLRSSIGLPQSTSDE